MTKKNNDCYLDSKFKQCCCNCKYWWPVHFHCKSNEGKSLRNQLQCACSIQKGWICAHPEFNIAYYFDISEQHSIGCELYVPKAEKILCEQLDHPSFVAQGETLPPEDSP